MIYKVFSRLFESMEFGKRGILDHSMNNTGNTKKNCLKIMQSISCYELYQLQSNGIPNGSPFYYCTIWRHFTLFKKNPIERERERERESFYTHGLSLYKVSLPIRERPCIQNMTNLISKISCFEIKNGILIF